MLEKIEKLLNMSSEQVALLSVLVTVLLYLLGKNSELKFKKHELKQEKYMQFIDLLKDMYNSKGQSFFDDAFKNKVFSFGSTVFIYGSKKMYKKYCFFREFSSDYIKKCKFYDEKIILFLVADMLNQIRKEIGMYDFELSLNYKSISFFINDIYFGLETDIVWWQSKIRVFLIKLELFLYKIIHFVPIKIFLNIIIFPLLMFVVICKCFILIPLGWLLKKFGITTEKLEGVSNKKVKK